MSVNRIISLRHLRCFLEVTHTGSFTAAAARLFVTQSSLTATIQQFEETIGIKLFDRTTRRVVLTAEGETFRPEAESIVKQFEIAIDDLMALAEGRKGLIRIAAAASVIYSFLVDALTDFRHNYPGVTFVVRDAGAEHVERMVLDGEIDFAVASRHKGNDALEYTPVLTDRYGIICDARHPLASSTAPIRWEDLPHKGLIEFTEDTNIGRFLRKSVGHLLVMHETNDQISSTTSLYALLRTGASYSVVPALAANIGSGDLRFRELMEPTLSRDICLITRRLRSQSPSTGRLLDILLRTIAKNPLPPGVTAIVPGAE
jgi:DNA-binding transcriptional LysR family regulator